MRRDDALLLDMLIAARRIQKFTLNMTRAAFFNSEITQSAVMREIQVIGEAARMITDETKAQQHLIPWQAVSGMRNRVIHQYFDIDLSIVWDTIETDIPALISQLEKSVPPEESTSFE